MQIAIFILVTISIVAYVLSWALYLYRAVKHETNYEKLASGLIVTGFFCQTMAIAAHTLADSGHFFSTSNVLLLVSWLLFFGCFMFEVVTKNRDRSVFLLPVPLIVLVISCLLV